MRYKLMALFNGQKCEVLMIDFKHDEVLLRMRTRSVVYMDSENPYTQRCVSIKQLDDLWIKRKNKNELES
jgi:hypothetical protein